jgi:radical SAM protein with 4Fe4S-binding SPASM domain
VAEIKILADDKRIKLSDAVPLDTPFSVYIFPTNVCNFRCSYCAQSLGREGLKEKYNLVPAHMDMKTFYRTVDRLKDFPQKIKTINLTGQGEPLLNKRLPEMVSYLKKADVTNRIEFMTNASLLTRDVSQKLIDGGLDCIRISLQGLSSSKYKEVCGFNMDFDTFFDNIKWFFDHKKQCSVFIKIMDITLSGKTEEKRFYDSFGSVSDRVYIESCKPVYEGVASTDSLSLSTDRYGREHAPRTVCPLCFFMLGIFPNGDVSPCETIYLPQLFGNVHTDSLFEIWNGNKRLEFLKMQLQKNRMTHPQCKRCSAPDDVSHPEDALDGAASEIMDKINAKR